MRRRSFIRKSAIFGASVAIGGLVSFIFGCKDDNSRDDSQQPANPEQPSTPDTKAPTVTLTSDKSQYNIGEDVSFTGYATKEGQKVEVEEEGIDFDYAGKPNKPNSDLKSLTAILKDGFDIPGVYRYITGWARDASGLGLSEKLRLVVKPYSQFSEVDDSIKQLASYSEIVKETTAEEFDLMYSLLSAEAKSELDGLKDAIAGSTIDSVVKYHLTDKGLIYEMAIKDKTKFEGFTRNSYFGHLDLSQETYDEIHKILMEEATEKEALDYIDKLAPEGAIKSRNQKVDLLQYGAVKFDSVIRYFLPNAQETDRQEITLCFEYQTEKDSLSSEEEDIVEKFNKHFNNSDNFPLNKPPLPYLPFSALAIDPTTGLEIAKKVLLEIQYHEKIFNEDNDSSLAKNNKLTPYLAWLAFFQNKPYEIPGNQAPPNHHGKMPVL